MRLTRDLASAHRLLNVTLTKDFKIGIFVKGEENVESLLDKAKAEMEKRGVPLLADITLGTLREAIYHPDDLHGAMMGLVWYPTATPMEAIKTKGS